MLGGNTSRRLRRAATASAPTWRGRVVTGSVAVLAALIVVALIFFVSGDGDKKPVLLTTPPPPLQFLARNATATTTTSSTSPRVFIDPVFAAWDEIVSGETLRRSTAVAAGLPRLHDFSPQLPPGARRFCTAAPGSADMEVMQDADLRPDPPATPSVLPELLVDIAHCPSPVALLPFPGVNMYPTRKCGAVKAWRTLRIPRGLLGSGFTAAQYNGAAAESKKAAVAAESGVVPPAVRGCLEHCLASPCCLAFVVDRANATCTLNFCDYTAAHHFAGPVQLLDAAHATSYVLRYRREYRPSLVLDAPSSSSSSSLSAPGGLWRIALHRGPRSVVRVGASGEWLDSEGRMIDVRVHARHGFPVARVAGRLRVALVDVSNNSEVPIWATDEPIIAGRCVLRVEAPHDLRPAAGAAYELRLSATLDEPASVAAARADGVLERQLAPLLPLPTAPLVLAASFFIHRNATDVELAYDSEGLAHGAADCAPLLRADECCVRGIFARAVVDLPGSETSPVLAARAAAAAAGGDAAFDMPPRESRGVSSAALEDRMAVLEQVDRFDCMRIVDGHHSHFTDVGRATFPNLVVWVNRSNAAACGFGPADGDEDGDNALQRRRRLVTLRARSTFANDTDGAMTWSATLRFDMLRLRGCGAGVSKTIAATAADAPASSTADGDPILVSIPAHECVECLESFLRNIRAFVWPSVVVVHYPPTVDIDAAALQARFAASHPHVFINDERVDSVVGVRLLHIHAVNVRFAERRLAHIRWSHALYLASNEMFVRSGVVAYIRRHDFVWMEAPTPISGALFEHNGDGRHKWTNQRFMPSDEMLRLPQRQWGFVWPDAVVADHWLAAGMRRRGLTAHPRETLLLEGTFMRADIAREFAAEMYEMFPPHHYCEEPMLYPHCEIIMPTMFQNACRASPSSANQGGRPQKPPLRCGFRVTTMLWKNDAWTARVDDVRRVRCSPFEVPFGFKRVPRDVNDPVRRAIMALEGDTQRRDANWTYCFEGGAV